ncbi:uncharacterized [Tachysurus ichikawai]
MSYKPGGRNSTMLSSGRHPRRRRLFYLKYALIWSLMSLKAWINFSLPKILLCKRNEKLFGNLQASAIEGPPGPPGPPGVDDCEILDIIMRMCCE